MAAVDPEVPEDALLIFLGSYLSFAQRVCLECDDDTVSVTITHLTDETKTLDREKVALITLPRNMTRITYDFFVERIDRISTLANKNIKDFINDNPNDKNKPIVLVCFHPDGQVECDNPNDRRVELKTFLEHNGIHTNVSLMCVNVECEFHKDTKKNPS